MNSTGKTVETPKKNQQEEMFRASLSFPGYRRTKKRSKSATSGSKPPPDLSASPRPRVQAPHQTRFHSSEVWIERNRQSRRGDIAPGCRGKNTLESHRGRGLPAPPGPCQRLKHDSAGNVSPAFRARNGGTGATGGAQQHRYGVTRKVTGDRLPLLPLTAHSLS